MKRLLVGMLLAAVVASAQVSYLWSMKTTEGDVSIDLAAFNALVFDKNTGRPAYLNLWGNLYTANERCNALGVLCTFTVSVRSTLDGVQQAPAILQLPATKWPKYDAAGQQNGFQQGTVRVAMRFPYGTVIQDVSIQTELRESLSSTVLKVDNWQTR